MIPSHYPYIEVEGYLTLDRNSAKRRYEYFDGELLMLTGDTTYHSIIKTNLIGIIYGSQRKKSCRIFGSDIRLQLSESCYVHPDIAVSCDARDHELVDTIRYPHLVVEVLSSNTEAIDRGKKLINYLENPTLQEYVMADSQRIRIEVYHREEDGWKLRIYRPDNIVRLASLDLQFSVADVYEDIAFDTITTDDVED